MKLLNLKGRKIGKLSVLKIVKRRQGKRRRWIVKCECGKVKSMSVDYLTSGNAKSCGCARLKGNPKHNMKYTKEYRAWIAMKQRCLNKNGSAYANYGGRGIQIASKWMNSFMNFFQDVGMAPSPNHSIERIKNSLGYFPKNVIWATRREQARNQRSNVWLSYNGKRMIMKDWARYIGINYLTLLTRLKRGWSVSKSLSTPISQ